ncbi:MAG: SRPBCC domain-containing protein [Streptosporangiaceae bacterium]
MLDSLNRRNGQSLRELCAGEDMARQSVSKHLAILEDANLVTTVRRGRGKLHYLNAAPISEIAERWINRYDQPRIEAFVYTTYISTTPERLWQALTDPAFTRRYWGGVAFESDWRAGSAFTLELGDGVKIADPAAVLGGITEGWPRILSGLKTLLETADPQPMG